MTDPKVIRLSKVSAERMIRMMGVRGFRVCVARYESVGVRVIVE